jgi:hypothetical protein
LWICNREFSLECNVILSREVVEVKNLSPSSSPLPKEGWRRFPFTKGAKKDYLYQREQKVPLS